MVKRISLLLFILLSALGTSDAQESEWEVKSVPVALGWAGNSVNAAVFRKNSLVTARDTQFIAFYDAEGYLTLGRRLLTDNVWTLRRSQYKGNVRDAHNVISIMADGEGYLHVAWDHHGSPLRYAISKEPYGLELGDVRPMTGVSEEDVTYPEFFRTPCGGLVFIYRDGGSGRGNLVMKKYDLKGKIWTSLQDKLIDGQGERNAYWQACIDDSGTIHISWVWRETPDVMTNHDICYARSRDGGITWENSAGATYELPITAATAEMALRIPQQSELINQTSMTTDNNGNPYIATYWRGKGSEIPQYHIVYHDGAKWNVSGLNFRSAPFTLGGTGTKRIPISRPQVVPFMNDGVMGLLLVFRDEERGEKVSAAICTDISANEWEVRDLTDFPVGAWEPSFDTELWRKMHKLHLFVQNVDQVDGEGMSETGARMVYVLEVERQN